MDILIETKNMILAKIIYSQISASIEATLTRLGNIFNILATKKGLKLYYRNNLVGIILI